MTVESTYGFFSDDTSIDVDGTSYVVFARLDVPADGTYDVDIANASADTTVVLGHYTTDDTLGWSRRRRCSEGAPRRSRLKSRWWWAWCCAPAAGVTARRSVEGLLRRLRHVDVAVDLRVAPTHG